MVLGLCKRLTGPSLRSSSYIFDEAGALQPLQNATYLEILRVGYADKFTRIFANAAWVSCGEEYYM